MSREMKNIISNMMKYDLIAGFIFVLILYYFFNLKVALIFFLGLMISLINSTINGLVIEYSLLRDKKLLLPLSYIFRIIAIVLIATPFLNNLIQLLSYISGYLTHFLLVMIYWLKKEKGSD